MATYYPSMHENISISKREISEKVIIGDRINIHGNVQRSPRSELSNLAIKDKYEAALMHITLLSTEIERHRMEYDTLKRLFETKDHLSRNLVSSENELKAKNRKLEEIGQENDRLNYLLREKNNEIQILQEKLLKMPAARNYDEDIIKWQKIIEKKKIKIATLKNQVGDLNTKLTRALATNEQIILLKAQWLEEKNHYQDKLAMITTENERLRMENEKLAAAMEGFNFSTNIGYSNSDYIKNLEEKLKYVNGENLKLDRLLQEKDRELLKEKENMNKLHFEYETKLSIGILEVEQKMNHHILDLEKSIAQYKAQIESNKFDLNKLDLQHKQTTQALNESENRIKNLIFENDQIKTTSTEKLQQYQNTIVDLSNNLQRTESDAKEKTKQVDKLTSSLLAAEEKVIHLNSKVLSFDIENEQLRFNVNELRKELSNWKDKCSKLELSLSNDNHIDKRFENLQDKYADIESKHLNLVVEFARVQAEAESYRNKCTQFEEQLALAMGKFHECENKLKISGNEIQGLKQKLMEKEYDANEANALRGQIHGYMRDNENLKLKNQQLSTELKFASEKILKKKAKNKERKLLISQLNQEITRFYALQSDYNNLIKENDDLKNKINVLDDALQKSQMLLQSKTKKEKTSSTANQSRIAELENQLKICQDKLDQKRVDYDRLASELNECKHKISQMLLLEQQLFKKNQECEHLIEMNKKSYEEIAQKDVELKNRWQQINELKSSNAELQNTIADKEKTFTYELKRLTSELESYKNKLSELNGLSLENRNLKSALENNNRIIYNLNYELNNYKNEKDRLDLLLTEKDEKIDQLNRKCMELQSKITPQFNYQGLLEELKREKEVLINSLNKAQDEILELKNIIRELESKFNSENVKVRGLTAEKQSLIAELKNLQRLYEELLKKYSNIEGNENVLPLLQRQLEELNKVIASKDAEIKKLADEIVRLKKDIDALSDKEKKLLNQIQDQKNSFERELAELKIELQSLEAEKEKYRKIIQEKITEMESWQRKAKDISDQVQRLTIRNENLEAELKERARVIEELRDKLKKYITLEGNYDDTRAKLTKSEKMNSLLKSDIEKLKKRKENDDGDASLWKHRYVELEREHKALGEYEKNNKVLNDEIKLVREENKELRERYIKVQEEIKIQGKKIQELHDNNLELKRIIDDKEAKIRQITHQHQTELQNLSDNFNNKRNENEALIDRIKRLQDKIQEVGNQKDLKDTNLIAAQKEISILKERCLHYEKKIQELDIEFQKMVASVQEKNQELKQVKAAASEHFNKKDKKTSELEELLNSLSKKKSVSRI